MIIAALHCCLVSAVMTYDIDSHLQEWLQENNCDPNETPVEAPFSQENEDPNISTEATDSAA